MANCSRRGGREVWGALLPLPIVDFFMKPILTAERYTHGVRLSGYDRETYLKMTGYLNKLVLKEPKKIPGQRTIMEIKKKYYGETEDGKSVFIHRECLQELINYLADKNIPSTRIEIVDIPVPTAVKVDYTLFEHYVLRDYQETIREDILRPHLHSARVDLQTGKGKTLTSLASVAVMKERGVVMIPPKYFGIWEKALKETFVGYEDQLGIKYLKVSGSAELQNLINRGLENDLEGVEIILISSTTYRAYIDTFERLGEKIDVVGFNVPPPRFHEVIGAGWQINDEIQEDPGLVFRTDLYTNVNKQIYLSATPYTGNQFVTKMIDVMLPATTKCRLPAYDSYINVIGLLYSEPTIKPKDYLTPFKNTYNHARYETVMMKNPRRLDFYLKMVKRIVDGVYIKDRIEGQKCLLLCATVNFIDVLTAYLKKQYPDLQINRHVSGSPYDRLMTNDITVSTIKSSGTGVDIRNLREVILLQATDSKKDSIQILGRLRPLKNWPDVIPRLTFMVCNNIPHHCRYARNKENHFMGKTKSMRMMRL